MKYFTDLFSPETYEAFTKSDQNISGFRPRHRHAAGRVEKGSLMLCYMTRISRWFGVLEVLGPMFEDSSPVFQESNDPFTIRFKVKPRVWLPINHAIPMQDPTLWSALTFTRDLPYGSIAWTGKVRGSLVQLDKTDGELLLRTLTEQSRNPKEFPISEKDRRSLARSVVRRADRDVVVAVPEDIADEQPRNSEGREARESLKMQAEIARIGLKMGLQVWVPPGDRAAIERQLSEDDRKGLVQKLPFNFEAVTMRTVENIDVLWLKKRTILRAFEVEHTTSVYSGILRMADLVALHPNMDVHLYIVAPSSRREKVFQELMRPTFAYLDRGPLSEICKYLSYESIKEVAALPHLSSTRDDLIEEFEEEPSE